MKTKVNVLLLCLFFFYSCESDKYVLDDKKTEISSDEDVYNCLVNDEKFTENVTVFFDSIKYGIISRESVGALKLIEKKYNINNIGEYIFRYHYDYSENPETKITVDGISQLPAKLVYVWNAYIAIERSIYRNQRLAICGVSKVELRDEIRRDRSLMSAVSASIIDHIEVYYEFETIDVVMSTEKAVSIIERAGIQPYYRFDCLTDLYSELWKITALSHTKFRCSDFRPDGFNPNSDNIVNGVGRVDDYWYDFSKNIHYKGDYNWSYGSAKCIKSILKELTEANVYDLNQIIYESVNKIVPKGYQWTLGMDETMVSKGANATTRVIKGKVVTNFSWKKLENSSDLSIARTIIHEAIHAFLLSEFAKTTTASTEYPTLATFFDENLSNLNHAHHEEMGASFIHAIAHGLQKYSQKKGYDVPFYYCVFLSWGGLRYYKVSEDGPNIMTTVFKETVTSQSIRDAIQKVLDDESNGLGKYGGSPCGD